MATFPEQCEVVFRPRYGRRWKTACAADLGISRATLYRYLDDPSGVPDDVLAALTSLAAPVRPVLDDHGMVVLAASALVAVQREIDTHGFLRTPYPQAVRRTFDVGAARNLAEERSQPWPTDLRSLAELAALPLGLWAGDMAWDHDEVFAEVLLVENGEVTPECRELAAGGRDPEQEMIERDGYDALRAACARMGDGDAFYTEWRRCVVARPVLSTISEAATAVPGLTDLEDWTGFVHRFYDVVPESLAFGDHVRTCTVSGTLLRRARKGYHTESRDPAAITAAVEGRHGTKPFRPRQTLHLKRAFRAFWCHPGVAELALARGLESLGWQVALWPRRDRVDVEAVSPGGRRIAVDVKDHLSPVGLAKRFEGFKEYEATHECFVVVPDYVVAADRRFGERFENLRRSHGKPAVALRTVSALLREAEERA
ncbi:restriction endonuclease-related protein [Belnapia rosea]|uniref:Uncharacterized protein n=1 Tax=Belnapia rosea TaxID=938405 RepID=A0A1G7C1J4_9PROT|nr:hypothetical protein [Belnapia rosea]SDE32305.1 hypothetical protein SAMN04487779_102822 [Belnapia rosea]